MFVICALSALYKETAMHVIRECEWAIEMMCLYYEIRQ